VFTLGKSGDENNLLIRQEELPSIGATYYHSSRGGDITYHGPGQIVGYPIIDLENFFTDIHRYMRSLEEAVIQTLKEFDIDAGRIPGLTGVWIDPDSDKDARKYVHWG
jgi:Lipoate-protein ligase B